MMDILNYKTFNNFIKWQNRGFSLVELMVTVAIIGILGAIAIPTYSNYIAIGKQNAAKSILQQFYTLGETYRAEDLNGNLCPDCGDGADHDYEYKENDSGAVTTDDITAWMPGFQPRDHSMQAGDAVLYDYKITFNDDNGTLVATPVVGRDAPTGTITCYFDGSLANACSI